MKELKRLRPWLVIGGLFAGLGITIYAHRNFFAPVRPLASPVTASAPIVTAPVSGPLAKAPLQSGGVFSASKSVVAGGGTRSTGGNFAVTGTAGQSVTGKSNGGAFALESGFWADLSLQCSAITVNPASLPNATMGASYAQAFSQSGGTGALTYSLNAGSLPAGLVLSASGSLSGAATQAGNFAFTVKVTDANGCTGTRAYTLTVVVACPAITVNPAALAAMKVGVSFSQTITATGGAGNYSLAVTAGSLPNGLTLTPQGGLTGTPTQASSGSFTVTATDANNCKGTRVYSFTVTPPCNAITVSPASLNNGQVGVPYSRTLVATGGAGGYSFSISAGALPVGLTLTPQGVLSGKPEFAGTFAVTVQALDANSCAGTQSYSLVIAPRTVASVSAASFLGTAHAREMIVAGFSVDLATQTLVGNTIPLPTQLAGTTVKVRDNAGTERLAPLFYVSPGQINYQVPPGTALGVAQVTMTSGANLVTEGQLTVTAVAPGLFSANSDGAGAPAAVALRVKPGNVQSYEVVTQFDAGMNKYVPLEIDLGPVTEQVYLLLFGTGVRGRTSLQNVSCKIGNTNADVLFAAAQGSLVGLDQINVLVPRSLIGTGESELVLTVDGQQSNKVKIKIK